MVVWQDMVFAVGGIILALALVPSILSPTNKPAATTSFFTGLILIAFTISYATITYWLAAVSGAITAGLWFTLLFQVLLRRKKWKK